MTNYESAAGGDGLEVQGLIALHRANEHRRDLWSLHNRCRNPRAPVSGITNPEVVAARAFMVILMLGGDRRGRIDWNDVLSWIDELLDEARRIGAMHGRFELRHEGGRRSCDVPHWIGETPTSVREGRPGVERNGAPSGARTSRIGFRA